MRGDRFRIRTLRIVLAMTSLVCAVALAEEPAVVATVLGASITRNDLAVQTDDRPRARKLLASIWDHVAPHYIASRSLAATPGEIAELAAYERRFEAQDQSQRARKLAQLEQRLLEDGLRPQERARLQDFRATLQRLARYDAERAQEPPVDPALQAAQYARWVEMWKMNEALQEEYGGVVGRTALGPDPHGARAALLREYEEQGLLEIVDVVLREEVHAVLDAHPSEVIPEDQVDFTPYWKLPITPSYFPD